MNKIKAVAFDFDDTLSDWPSAVERAAVKLETEIAADEDAGFAERFLRAVAHLYPGRNPGPLWFEAHVPIEIALRRGGDAARLAERFRALIEPVAFDDVTAALAELTVRYRLAILSNNPYAPEGLMVLGLAHHFTSVIALREDGGRAKPHPDAFASLADALILKPANILCVGDSVSHDIEGALVAGMAAPWLDRFGALHALPKGAHRIVSLAELPALLQRL